MIHPSDTAHLIISGQGVSGIHSSGGALATANAAHSTEVDASAAYLWTPTFRKSRVLRVSRSIPSSGTGPRPAIVDCTCPDAGVSRLRRSSIGTPVAMQPADPGRGHRRRPCTGVWWSSRRSPVYGRCEKGAALASGEDRLLMRRNKALRCWRDGRAYTHRLTALYEAGRPAV